MRVSESDFTYGSMNEVELKDSEFVNSKLQVMEVMRTPLSGIDLRTCSMEGIRLVGTELKGAIVTSSQAIDLSKLLGIIIQDE